jgi:decaprenylphospho-beta-D-ribofuranose 2-oxidase
MNDPKLEGREGWGMAVGGLAHVVRPKSQEDVQAAFALARENGWTVAFWGNGNSYGDAALNEGQLLLDFSEMNEILSFDDEEGTAVLQPGVQLCQLSEYALPRGYWPPVVSGTMFTTIGGCASANVHGKNNWKYGPWGDHILSFTLVTPDGEVREVSRQSDAELFRHVIGGFGLLGAFVSITVKMKRVYSGRLRIVPFTASNLDGIFDGFEKCIAEDYDYIVGWIDAFPSGRSLGRGQIHAANYFDKGEDPDGERMMNSADQTLPDRFFLVIPKGWLWWLARPWAFRLGMRLINAVRFLMLNREAAQHAHLDTHFGFNHLLDYVPNWKWFYKPGGLIQYQLFVPKDKARAVFRQALEMSQDVGLEPWLVVMKRHREDEFPLSHAVDGYSLAMDYPVTAKNREVLWQLTQRLNDVMVDAGGKFYFAKDQVITPEAALGAWGKQVLGRFFALKQQYDPDALIQGNLWRRVFAPLQQTVPLLQAPDPIETITDGPSEVEDVELVAVPAANVPDDAA